MHTAIQKKIDRSIDIFNNSRDYTQFLFQLRFPDPEDLIRPYLSMENKQQRIDYAKRKYEYDLSVAERLDDDSIPSLTCVTGTEIFAQAFGCKVFYPEENIPCAIHYISEPDEAAKIVEPKLEDTPLMELFDIADSLYSYGGEDALLQIVDLQSPMDVVAQIWDKSTLLIAMLEDQEIVHELADKVYRLQTAFLDEWIKRYGKRFIAHYPSYLVDGGVSMSVDEVGIISPALFREFFLDELNNLSDRYGGIGIHCCAVSEHQFENFASVKGLKLMNLYRPFEHIKVANEVFKDICVQCHGGYKDGTPFSTGVAPVESFPIGSRIMMREGVKCLDDALRKCEEYSKIYRR